MFTDATHAAVLPFEIFAYLYNSHPASFAKRFLGSSTARIADAGDTLRSKIRTLCLSVFKNNSDAHRSFWRQIPDTDPRKVQIAEQLIERDDITCVDEIWGRAVPIDLHGDPNRKCLTRSAEERGMRML